MITDVQEIRAHAAKLEAQAQAREDQRRAEVESLREQRIEEQRKARAIAAQREESKLFIAKHGIPATTRHFASLVRGERMSSDFVAAMGDTNQSGGFLIPNTVLDTVVRNTDEYGIAREYCRPAVLASGIASIPIVKRDVAIYNVTQFREGTMSLDDIEVSNANVNAQSLAVTARATAELVDSAPDWGEAMIASIGVGFRQIEDRLVFSTAGATWTSTAGLCELLLQPERAGGLVTTGSGATTLASVTAAKLREMIGKLPARAHRNARWFAHPKAISDILLRLTGPENDTGDMEERIPFAVDNGQLYIAQFPVVPVSAMPSAPAAGEVALLLGDLRKATTLAKRGSEEIQMSNSGPDTFLLLDSLLRGTLRVGVGFADIGTADKAGSVVALKLAES
jgi:HK97 family phage major capsid protein